MKKDLTYIVFVIDRSGSMASIRADMIGGFNTFIKTQKDAKLGKCKVFAYKFDTIFEPMFENLDLEEVPVLTEESFVPRGGTALYASIGKTIKNIENHLELLKDKKKPSNILFVTITDGGNNDFLENKEEKNYSLAEVKEMIKNHTEKDKWDFAYIGANQDAWAVGGSMSMGAKMNYSATPQGTALAFKSLTRSAELYRSSEVCDSFTFVEEEDKNT